MSAQDKTADAARTRQMEIEQKRNFFLGWLIAKLHRAERDLWEKGERPSVFQMVSFQMSTLSVNSNRSGKRVSICPGLWGTVIMDGETQTLVSVNLRDIRSMLEVERKDGGPTFGLDPAEVWARAFEAGRQSAQENGGAQ